VSPHQTAHALGVARAPEVACARLGTLYWRSEQSGERRGRRGRRGSGKGDWADGEGGDVARGWRRLPAWARWGLIALAVVIALGWALAPAARAVDLVANRVGRAAPDARVTGHPRD